jgi:hypothetical protein
MQKNFKFNRKRQKISVPINTQLGKDLRGKKRDGKADLSQS